jgi:hypothetical protein
LLPVVFFLSVPLLLPLSVPGFFFSELPFS